MSIPKIIHHIWMGNKPIADLNMYAANSVKQHHPDFKYTLWKDAEIDAFMKTEFPDYYNKFNELPRMIMKIDMFRYFLMYKIGGLYTDMDYLMFRPFDLLHHTCVIPCNRETDSGDVDRLGNCIFASVPNHPFWKALIDTLFTIDRTQLSTHDSNVDGHEWGTGPVFVYEMWKKYKEEHDDINVSRRHLFHPPTKMDQNYIEKLRNQNCYGMHLCTGLWRNNKL
jgi:inositol phosphorylceramide mannosyltransferase catalytic subunit